MAQRAVLVTGASRGIGRAIAQAFAELGDRVAVHYSASAELAAQVAGELPGSGHTVVQADLADPEAVRRMVDQAHAGLGGLDVLVNNAGILRDRMIVSMSEQDWDSVLAVHLKGGFATLHHAAAYWREQAKSGRKNDARVINTTSPSGLFGNPGQSNYGAAKAGLASLTIIAAAELARYGVTVNAIAPTALTRLTEDIAMMREAAETTDLSPEAVAPLVVWLGSAASREITGRVFAVAGNQITVLEGWANGLTVMTDSRWSQEELTSIIPNMVAKAAPNADGFGNRTSA